jgi:hypothetical protein
MDLQTQVESAKHKKNTQAESSSSMTTAYVLQQAHEVKTNFGLSLWRSSTTVTKQRTAPAVK